MLSFTFILLLAISTVFAAPANNTAQFSCANHPDADEVDRMESAFSTDMAAMGINDQTVSSLKATIPVYFHVIRKGNAPSQGNIPDWQIKKQIKVLNKDFKSTGIKFDLKDVDRTTNVNWFRLASFSNSYQTEMKEKLRRGGAAALNVYSVGFEEISLLGYATFPEWYAGNPKDDGAVFHYATVPEGTYPNYGLGKVLVHEVGHWVGLYHTFQGGCTGFGDGVDDTPAEETPAFYCPKGRDTCPGGGKDPIHNFMDYTYDKCKDEFTKGQAKRLKAQLATYRGI